jgi:hypothetical protein
LLPLMKLRFAAPELLVDINNIPRLAYHHADPDGTLHVGSLWQRPLPSSPIRWCATAAHLSGRSATRIPRVTGLRS